MYFLAREREQHDSAIMRGKLTMAAYRAAYAAKGQEQWLKRTDTSFAWSLVFSSLG
jgi:hypothetical protein